MRFFFFLFLFGFLRSGIKVFVRQLSGKWFFWSSSSVLPGYFVYLFRRWRWRGLLFWFRFYFTRWWWRRGRSLVFNWSRWFLFLFNFLICQFRNNFPSNGRVERICKAEKCSNKHSNLIFHLVLFSLKRTAPFQKTQPSTNVNFSLC